MAQKKGFGLDIGQNAIKLVELKKERSGISLSRLRIARTGVTSSMSREQRDSAIAEALGAVLKGISVKQDPFVLATPGLSAFIRYVKLPKVSPARLKQIISYEAQQQVPFPLNEVIWDYQVLKEKTVSETSIVLVAIKRDVLNAHIRLVNVHGIGPTIIEHRPLAVYNCVKFNEDTDENEVSVIIDIGERTTDISVEKEGELCWTRSARIGSMEVTEALKKGLDVSFEEAERIKEEELSIIVSPEQAKGADGRTRELWEIAKKPLGRIVSEIQRSLNYFQTQLGGTRADKIILSGGFTKLENFDGWISTIISGPEVMVLNPLKRISCPPGLLDNENSAQSLNVAAGLALRALGEGFSDINLLPENVLSRQELRKKRAYIVLSGISMALMLGIAHTFTTANYSILEDNIRIINEEISDYQVYERQLREYSMRQRDAGDRLETVKKIIDRSWKWPDLLLEISRVIPHNVTLTQMGYVALRDYGEDMWHEQFEEPDRVDRRRRVEPVTRAPGAPDRVLEVRGTARSFGTIENIISRAESSPAFKKVEVKNVERVREVERVRQEDRVRDEDRVREVEMLSFTIHMEVAGD